MAEYTITREDGASDAAHLRSLIADRGHDFKVSDLQVLIELADSIEEQVKPVIEEPTEFGSIVRASENLGTWLWQKTPMHGKHYWESENGAVTVWSELSDIEVLRIGVGERLNVAPEETEDYKLGASDFIQAALRQLRQLRAEAITSERKNAYDVAFHTVEGLQP